MGPLAKKFGKPALETKVFLNMMAKVGRQSKRHNNKSYYEPGIFEYKCV